MIQLVDIAPDALDAFWDAHFAYLVADGIVEDAEDKAYFQGDEYRQTIAAHMARTQDRHHLVYFAEDDVRVGAASYCTYASEDGKCFVLDFWIFPPHRNRGLGLRCFEALMCRTRTDGARYWEINCDGRADRLRFWHSVGFVADGVDEWGDPLLTLRRKTSERVGHRVSL